MFSQLQTRYPTASLVSELLQVQDGNFVVRAVVQVNGVPLASAMAAASSVEQAEDQARIRVLAVLGLHATYELQPDLLLDSSSKSQTTLARLEPTADSFTPAEPSAALPSQTQPPAPPIAAENHLPDWSFSPATAPVPSVPSRILADTDLLPLTDASPLPEPATEPQLALEPLAVAQNQRLAHPVPEIQNGKAAIQPLQAAAQPDLLSAPVDLSDIIAQTSVELKRLKWSNAEGRSYLQRTYGKRSRQELTDEQLLEFLHYLQAQTAANEPFF
ncbi:MAG TPA: hypothetical protein V6D03_02585 [Candidatus Caenarcaniphilales bacterium]